MKKYLALCLALCLLLCGCTKEPAAPAETAPLTMPSSDGTLVPVQTMPASDGTLVPIQTLPASNGDMPVVLPASNGNLPASNGGEHYSIAALKGPTAMGLVKLMQDADSGAETLNDYSFTLAGSADEVTPLLVKGELDMACVPANLASVLYNKTQGKIVTLAINTLGVIYIVEKGETLTSIQDLKGATIVAAGKGSTPEFALRYLLTENGIDPDTDVTIEWKSEHAECVSALGTGAATIAMLPQPFVTVAQGKVEGLRVALDLTEEWDKLEGDSGMVTGVIVTRPEVIERNPDAIRAFLQEYAQSVAWVNENVSEAAELIGSYDIVAAPVAEKALPYCNIVCITGEEMQAKLSGYLKVLYDAAPESVGGEFPGEGFFFN